MSSEAFSFVSITGLSLSVFLVTACSITPADSSTDGGVDAAVVPQEAGVAIKFAPSNTPAPSFEGLGDVDISSPCEINTDTGKTDCAGLRPDAFSYSKVDQGTGASKIAVFAMRSLRIEPSAVLRVSGSLPFVAFAATNMDVQGGLDASSDVAVAHAGGYVSAEHGDGLGPGGGGSSPNYNGGAGGSYCGIGGTGGVDVAPGSTQGSAYGSPALSPLVAGSAGGSGQYGLGGLGGAGGGAVQLVAGAAINVAAGGFVSVGGGGGTHNGGGGGSGGSLLLESPTISMSGKLAANGGGGTIFNGGNPGENGGRTAARAQGSTATAGTGSSDADINGTSGTILPPDKNSSGSGGGGAGRIRLNTTTGAAQITGVVSPSLATSCATQGAL